MSEGLAARREGSGGAALRRRLLIVAAAALLLVAVAFAAAGCGGAGHGGMMGGGMGNMMSGTQPPGSIRVGLVNWAVDPEQTSTQAGVVTFWTVHEMDHMHSRGDGGATHDLQVMRATADGSFELAGQVQGLRMGEARTLTLDLARGDYELSCNVVEEIDGKMIGHYAKGMRTPFRVD